MLTAQIVCEALCRIAYRRCDCPGCIAPRKPPARGAWFSWKDKHGNTHYTSEQPHDPLANAISFANPSNTIGKRMGAAQYVK